MNLKSLTRGPWGTAGSCAVDAINVPTTSDSGLLDEPLFSPVHPTQGNQGFLPRTFLAPEITIEETGTESMHSTRAISLLDAKCRVPLDIIRRNLCVFFWGGSCNNT